MKLFLQDLEARILRCVASERRRVDNEEHVPAVLAHGHGLEHGPTDGALARKPQAQAMGRSGDGTPTDSRHKWCVQNASNRMIGIGMPISHNRTERIATVSLYRFRDRMIRERNMFQTLARFP